MVEILKSTYVKSKLKQVADNSTHLNAEEITLLLSLLDDFQDLFDSTLGNWATDTVTLDLKPYSRPFNSIYYPLPIINKETFRKELKLLIYIGVLNTVQQTQYVTPYLLSLINKGL